MNKERIIQRKKNKNGNELRLPLIKTTAKEISNPMKKILRNDTTLRVRGCHGSKSKCAISRCFLIFASSAAETFSLMRFPKLLHHRSYLEISGAISSLNLM